MQKTTFDLVIPTSIGSIGLSATPENLTKIVLLPTNYIDLCKKSSILTSFKKELKKYFINPTYQFKTPILLKGTLFQLRVWKEIMKIPVGDTRTYGELACMLHSSPRAVGQACKTNKFPLIIPCHRIISMNSIGGFCGAKTNKPIEIKRYLLEHEGNK